MKFELKHENCKINKYAKNKIFVKSTKKIFQFFSVKLHCILLARLIKICSIYYLFRILFLSNQWSHAMHLNPCQEDYCKLELFDFKCFLENLGERDRGEQGHCRQYSPGALFLPAAKVQHQLSH